MRRELTATSSQDEFAKWAKLRRQHDKLLDQLEKTSTYLFPVKKTIMVTRWLMIPSPHSAEKSMESSRSKFDSALTVGRLVLTRAPQYILPFWYAKQPMFWLPHGWFPYYAEWIISFPRAPLGSVSIASWQLACTAIVALVSDTLRGIFGVLFGRSAAIKANRKAKETPVKAEGEKKEAKGSSTGTPTAAAAKKRKSTTKEKQEL